jgi:hypothetical protein
VCVGGGGDGVYKSVLMGAILTCRNSASVLRCAKYKIGRWWRGGPQASPIHEASGLQGL